MKNELEKVERLYTSNILKYGISSKSVGWNSEKCQSLRFEKLLSLIDVNHRFSINELGCGYGALIDYMSSHGYDFMNYNGIDISEEMIKQAKSIYQNNNIQFIHSDSLSSLSDFSVASGIFNVKFDVSKDIWEKYILDTLNNMNQYSKYGFSFNLLSSYVDYEEKHLYYGDPCFFFNYCKKHFSKKVSILHDYPLWEWTITIFKG